MKDSNTFDNCSQSQKDDILGQSHIKNLLDSSVNWSNGICLFEDYNPLCAHDLTPGCTGSVHSYMISRVH